MAEYTIDKFTYDGNTYKLKSSTLKNLVDGSQEGSIRGINTATESSTYTIGTHAFAEGNNTEASGQDSHAEGLNSKARGYRAHAEGYRTTASGNSAHTEGYNTVASGTNSHAEGDNTTASGEDSHVEGYGTIANHAYQHVFGLYNAEDDSTATATNKGNYIEIVGNGAYNARANARTLDWSGNETLSGKLTLGAVGVNSMDAATVGQIPSVPAWALASTKPTYTAVEVGAQPTLVSGTNIKTINSESILGSGDITIQSGSSKNVWYGTCSSAAGDDPKIVTTDTGDFTLTTGNIIYIKFTSTSGLLGGEASYLNVDGTGAIGARYSRNGYNGVGWSGNTILKFVYDGSYFQLVNRLATTLYPGEVVLNSAIDSTSTTTAATPKAVSDLAAAIDAEFDNLATVASSGSYTDLTNKPSIPVVDSQLSTASTNAIQNKAVTEAYFTNAKNTWYGVGNFANDVLTVSTTQHTQYTTAFEAALGHTVRVLMTSDAEFTSTSTANVDGTGAYTIFNGEDGVVTAGDLITLTFENRYEQGNMYVVSYVSKKSGVTAGTYDGGAIKGVGYYVPSLTVDIQGHVTDATDLGNLIPIVNNNHVANPETPVLTTGYSYSSKVTSINRYTSDANYTYILPAHSTSKAFSITHNELGIYFKIIDVNAFDMTNYEPVIVDWKSNRLAGYNGMGTVTLTITIAKEFDHDIMIDPIISYGAPYGGK